MNDSLIISTAVKHYLDSSQLPSDSMPQHSKMWGRLAGIYREFILSAKTPREVIDFAQTENRFDHRDRKHRPSFTYQYFENILYNIHSSARELLPLFCETPVSKSGSVKLNNPLYDSTRLVSTTLFIHTSFILSCLEYRKNISSVCEIGGGYGDIARLWLTTPPKIASLYFIIDLPESLFFAEVFMRTVFPDLKISYITNEAEAVAASVNTTAPHLILCPIQLHATAKNFKFDITINTISFGEMTQEWTNFWSAWINQQNTNLFYTSNNFGSELDRMFECENLLAPAMPANWMMTKYTLDHPFQSYWAEYCRRYGEFFFERTSDNKPRASTLADYYKIRQYTRFTINDVAYCIHNLDSGVDINLEMKLVQKFLNDMNYIPKELLHWVRRLTNSQELKTATAEIQNIIKQISERLEMLYKNQKANVLHQCEKKVIED